MKFIKHPLLIISFLFLLSCSQPRQVVPYEVDSDEIYKALPPNETDATNELTFGTDNIPGVIFDYDFTTGSEDVYIFFENFTLLNINPKINNRVFDFIKSGLKEYGFIPETDSISSEEFSELYNDGLTYAEAAAKILDQIKTQFESKAPEFESYNSPFNAYFQIYPVYLTPEYVTYRLSAYYYTGGAHGITISYLYTFNLSTGEVLSLEDIVKPDAISTVKEEVAAHMAYSYPIYENITTVDQYIDSLNVWLDNFESPDKSYEVTASDFPVSDVALLSDGLAFIYQMYELTPGADGCPVVLIPYKDIKGCLLIQD